MTKFKDNYQKKIIPALKKELGVKSVMALPRLKKVVINIGLGRSLKDEKFLEVATKDLALIAGQKLKTTAAKQSIANFKTRQGMIVGAMATLRGERMYDFVSRLIDVALPRSRDFRGLNPKSIDKSGNLTIGVKEHIVFPEIKGEEVRNIFGFEITFAVKAKNRDEAIVLYKTLGFPMK
ncbi:50S ribosomal protein L5 [Candidatus Azambacteria bacterium]|nr:50S ribosomal protein L5 [Candidatus Azambacteria bacterium]